MKVFLTGASGFIGSAIAKKLIANGNQIVGLARSDASAKKLAAAGIEVIRGSLDDLDSMKRGAAKSDGVIHTAFIHEFSYISLVKRLKVIFGGLPSSIAPRFLKTIADMDRMAIEVIGTTLAGSGRPLVIASGTLLLPLGRLVNETDLPDPASPAAYRAQSEKTAIDFASKGVHTSIIRLPPTVHGDGDSGFIPRLIKLAQKTGVSACVNDGQNEWPAVHRLDVAGLFILALEKGTAGSVYHGVAEEGIPFSEIAKVIGVKLNLPFASKPEKHFGFLGSIVAADNETSSAITQEKLGWTPKEPTLIADLENGNYFA
ncbi:MAG: SDR family oxidoreductase [Bacteroidota bacterium]|nr:SDR family oxidoreductase [Bacteroidota bacterium]